MTVETIGNLLKGFEGRFAAEAVVSPEHSQKPSSRPASAGHQAGRRPRRLSDRQRGTFLGIAASRVKAEAAHRQRCWLRRLDVGHESGYRMHQARWNALAAVIEPLLARLDIATLCLGWLDANGSFRLNRQRGIAEDAGLGESRLSRLLGALEKVGYLRRKFRRIYSFGKTWITRVTLHVRPRFFIDLGLGHQLAAARTHKKQIRQKALAEAKQREQQRLMNALLGQYRQAERQKKAEQRERREVQQQVQQARQYQARAQTDRWQAFREAHAHLGDSEILALWRRQNPG